MVFVLEPKRLYRYKQRISKICTDSFPLQRPHTIYHVLMFYWYQFVSFGDFDICFRIVPTVWYFFVLHFINHEHGQYNYRVSQSLLAKNVEYVAERSLFTEHKDHN